VDDTETEAKKGASLARHIPTAPSVRTAPVVSLCPVRLEKRDFHDKDDSTEPYLTKNEAASEGCAARSRWWPSLPP
jgi:hypothetical protein